jgi:dTDP-glucose 4,6-dehydratase
MQRSAIELEGAAVLERGSTWRRAVITGGAGFLGTHLCRSLLAGGTEVLCVDNFLTSSPMRLGALRAEPGFKLIEADVAEGLEVDGDVDLIVHLASPASPLDYQRYPLATLDAGSRGTRNALGVAARTGARFVLASTSEVYGDPAVSPQPEGYWGNVNPVGPRSVYDESKRFAEAMTAAYRRAGRVNAGIARIFNTYGPGMRLGDGRVVPAFASQALRGLPLTVAGDGSQTRSLCHVDDTVRGILAVAGSDMAGPVNIGNPDEATVLQIAERIIALSGSSSGIEHIPLPEDDPLVRCPDITLAGNALGWEPTIAWREGLSQTLAWFSGQLDANGFDPSELESAKERTVRA